MPITINLANPIMNSKCIIPDTATKIVARLQLEGIHRWLLCPIEEVNYLRNYHRHVFHIIAHCYVNHSDRDIEFIELTHKIKTHLNDHYYDDMHKCLFFDDNSCEMIASELLHKFNLDECEVNEDGESGSIVTKVRN